MSDRRPTRIGIAPDSSSDAHCRDNGSACFQEALDAIGYDIETLRRELQRIAAIEASDASQPPQFASLITDSRRP